jgi:site-specific DNA-methyltransferase (adenine-specific)|tara:strand:- start:322 stop:1122 length:801 start_codon:yes stop_codon:yes gene_type:complete
MQSRFDNSIDLELLRSIEKGSVDLVLTDPPYLISRKSGMQSHSERNPDDKGYNQVSISKQRKPGPWAEGKGYVEVDYGRKYATATDFGQWDKDYTIDDLQLAINEFYRILRPGGSCIIFFDLWKIETLTNALSKFSKHRLIEWLKTNPVPINSKATYLSNAREIAISCVKGGKATFNSKYDKGVYEYPIYGGKDRFHPTQKSLPLFEELIKKHSNEGDIVVDPYGGSGTTYIAAVNTNRVCLSCEIDKDYYGKVQSRIGLERYVNK